MRYHQDGALRWLREHHKGKAAVRKRCSQSTLRSESQQRQYLVGGSFLRNMTALILEWQISSRASMDISMHNTSIGSLTRIRFPALRRPKKSAVPLTDNVKFPRKKLSTQPEQSVWVASTDACPLGPPSSPDVKSGLLSHST